MTEADKRIVIKWLGETGTKGLVECTEIEASRHDIGVFINECEAVLQSAVEAGSL